MAVGSTSNRNAVLHQLSSEQYRQLDALLDQALDIAPAQHRNWIEQQNLEAPILPMLQRLLAANVAEKAKPIVEQLPKIEGKGNVSQDDESLFLSRQIIGRYTLDSRIGVGGMGEVWKAFPSDGTLNRAVALKLAKTGAVDAQLLARFSFERDNLARLNHPNIARLYDAGYQGTQPYMALELVDGISIDQYCSVRRIDLRQRIKLFTQVIDAIQYAHNNLLIHRDIKPSNILVTPDGQVKLLDFGIAKHSSIVEASNSGRPISNTDQTNLTQFGAQVLTPKYASPEQMLGQTVSTASDIYSLGVVLYELLTGLSPFAPEKQSIDQKVVLQPSTRLTTDSFSEAIHLAPHLLKRSLSDGLDAVLLTALAQNPNQRYATAQAFGDDLRAWLDGQTVKAVPPSKLYTFRKFATRHPWGLGLGTIALCAVIVTSVLAQSQAVKASKAAQSTQQVTTFLIELLNANSGRKISTLTANASRQATAEQLLNGAIAKLQNKPSLDNDVQKNLLKTVADLTHELHMNDQTIKLREQHLNLLSREIDKVPELLTLSDSLFQAGKNKEIDPILATARGILEKQSQSQHEVLFARLQMREGRQFDIVGNYKESLPLLQKAAQTLAAIDPPDPDWIESQRAYFDGIRLTDPKACIAGYDQIINRLQQHYGAESPHLISVLHGKAANLNMQTDYAQSQQTYERVNQLHQIHPKHDPVGALLSMGEQGAMLRNSGQFVSSRRLIEKSLQGFKNLGLEDHPLEPTVAKLTYASSLLSDWDFERANVQLERIAHVWREISLRPPSLATALEMQSISATAQLNTSAARQLLVKARQLREKSLGPSHPTLYINEARAIVNESADQLSTTALNRYYALSGLETPSTGGAATFYLGEAKFLALPSLINLKQWERLIQDTQILANKAPATALARLRQFTVLNYRVVAYTQLKNLGAAQQQLDNAQKLKNELGENLPKPQIAQLLAAQIQLAKAQRLESKQLASLQSEFKQVRSQLAGETASFRKMANQL
jgi:serine/threonine protein kinase